MTRLDQAHARMTAAPDDDAARLRFFETLADTALYLLLDADPEGDCIRPKTVQADGVETALAFDREERLADFTGEPAPYAELPGRKLAEMLAGSGLALGLNIGVAPSETLLPPEAMGWLGDMLGGQGAELVSGLAGVSAPAGVDPDLVAALQAKLAGAAGLADQAVLVSARHQDGNETLLLAIVAAKPGTEGALRQAIAEAVGFTAAGASLDIGFFPAQDRALAPLLAVGRVFSIPEPPNRQAVATAPGMDPANPPRLR